VAATLQLSNGNGADEPATAEILRAVRRVRLRTRRAVSDMVAGGFRSVFRGSGMEFEEVREYVPGDDVRSIDWNVTARTGRPYVKKFVEEREQTVLLTVDVSASTRLGCGARAASACATGTTRVGPSVVQLTGAPFFIKGVKTLKVESISKSASPALMS